MLGKVTLNLSKCGPFWKVTDGAVSLLSTDSVEPYIEVLKQFEPYESIVQEWLEQPLGLIRGSMSISNPLQIRLSDNTFIEFVNKVQMEAAGVDISNTALFENLCPGFSNNVTMRQVISNYIYPNTLKVLRISGQDIKDALEQSAEYFILTEEGKIGVNPTYIEPKPQHYFYDMWEGIEYEINVSNPVGTRVVKLHRNGIPISMEDQYEVVMNNYRAAGGGNYRMFQDKPVIKEIQVDLTELIAQTIIDKKIIDATVNHNWIVKVD